MAAVTPITWNNCGLVKIRHDINTHAHTCDYNNTYNFDAKLTCDKYYSCKFNNLIESFKFACHQFYSQKNINLEYMYSYDTLFTF